MGKLSRKTDQLFFLCLVYMTKSGEEPVAERSDTRKSFSGQERKALQ